MNGLILYFKYSLMNIRCKLQYKAWPLYFLGTMITTVIDFLGVRIMFSRFGSLGGWTAAHTLLVFGAASLAFGLAEWLGRGFDVFPWQIRTGQFDKILLRPRSAFLQVMGERFQFEKGGRVAVGIFCMAIASKTLDITWTHDSAAAIAGAVAGGFLVYAGVMVIFAAISFFTVGAMHTVYIFTNHTLQYVQIPFHTFPEFIKHILTFVFPIGLCFYYPVLFTIGWDSGLLCFLAFPVGLLFFSASLIVWKICMGHYHSTGS